MASTVLRLFGLLYGKERAFSDNRARILSSILIAIYRWPLSSASFPLPALLRRSVEFPDEICIALGDAYVPPYITLLEESTHFNCDNFSLLQTKAMTTESTRPSVVTLPQGKVVGVQLENTFPQPVNAFLGIPYALPPVGDLRFRPGVKVSKSKDIIDGSKYGPAAPGKALLAGGPKLEQSEDCLTANVFRPSGNCEGGKRLPVAIYIHGGAFNRGSASMHDTASMVAWSEKPFIAVSFGYRLGALGFLPSGLTKKEGLLNLGLRDQILLFQWVQENIEAFGGDPGNVTLFGLSAGAHSVSFHSSCLLFLYTCVDCNDRSGIIFSTMTNINHHYFTE